MSPATPSAGPHGRRSFFELADIAQNAHRGRSATAISPLALEPVRRIDQLFEIERENYWLSAEERLRVRQVRSAQSLGVIDPAIQALASQDADLDLSGTRAVARSAWLRPAGTPDNGRRRSGSINCP